MTTVSWQLLRNPRVPITTAITLNVSTTGNDSTGDYTGLPFLTLQGAINYVASCLDFRVPVNLTVNVAAGSYDGLNFTVAVANLYSLTVTGAGATTQIASVVSKSPTWLILQNCTVTGADSATGSIGAWSGGKISLTGTVWINAQNVRPAIYAASGAVVSLDGGTVNFNTGAYKCMFYAGGSGYIQAAGATINFAAGCTVSIGVAMVETCGAFYLYSCTYTGTPTGPKYSATLCGSISGGSGLPSTAAGTTALGGNVS